MKQRVGILLLMLMYSAACTTRATENNIAQVSDTVPGKETVRKTEAQWKAQLTPQAYYVLREKGTERPFTGKFVDHKANGVYVCGGCRNPLFSSSTKFESGTGWPSFYAPVHKDNVLERADRTYGMVRVEVLCPQCGGHLGHVFDDGPKPTGLRYCINSVALDFTPSEKK